ncbi:MAG: DUF2949 domain-containing protein [Geminocystis sp.]|nr:DUF2949 domain-containing protein [Geminocystis sp.]HIK36391.1 DUF2949 domain-containing protein [Geminocystis sp. M7585_C2015_104]MCS7147986.1 DUF2949 domain-containing protein [Geminocystis sp.]MCX8078960.1 DUF2949 domain-containing protein [Geminocystis sp.]MDW8116934.1 DUF2949 domain-containing protein [Geminocystis sp.]
MPSKTYQRFIQFLQEEINLSQDSIAMAQKTVEENLGLMPVVLWQYGLVNIEQLNKIYEWLEKA